MDQPNNQDILAILKASRDLGPDYDEHAAEQIPALMPNDTQCTSEQASAYLAQLPHHERRQILQRFRKERRAGAGSLSGLLVLSIPLMAIAGGAAHAAGVFAVVALGCRGHCRDILETVVPALS